MQNAVQRFWRSAVPPLLGGMAIALLTVVCYRLQLNLAITAFLYLIVLVLVSVSASLPGSLALSALAVGLLHVVFAGRGVPFQVQPDLDATVLIAFGLTAVVVTGQASRGRRSLHQIGAMREELGLVIDSIPVLAWSNLPDGSVDFINRAWLEYTGLAAEDALRGGWATALHPDEADRILQESAAGTAGGKPYEIEGLLRRADGEYRWVLRRVVPLRDRDGNVAKWYGTGTDIDDLKRTEHALRSSEAYLAEAQRLSRTGSFGWDPSRAELRWSEETFRIFEYDSAKVTPTLELVLQRVHPDDLDQVHLAIDGAIRSETDWDLDHRLLMPDCRVKHVHVVAHAIRHASGALEFVGAVMDMTAARAAQAELERSEAYLAQAERLSHTGSWALRLGDPYEDHAPEQSYWSAEGYRIFGVDPATDPSPARTMRDRVHPEDWAGLVAAARRAIEEQSNFEADYRAVLPDGSIRYISAVGGPVVTAAGEVVELVGTVMDITDRKRAERAVRRARDRALAARFNAVLEERTRLAREIHDTLLQGFTGVALQLVAVSQRVAGPPETIAAFQELIGLAQRTLVDARHAVWDLRAPAPAEGDFPAAIRSAADDALRGTDLGLTYEVVGAPQPLGTAIEVAVSRVMQEAMANTVKHAGARSVRVELKYLKRGLRLTVADDGRGFVVGSDLRAYGGHWGLLGMKERAAQLCGTLQVQSAPEQGTTIVVRLPYPAWAAGQPIAAMVQS
jgi:PAS domain S-box-containing protein